MLTYVFLTVAAFIIARAHWDVRYEVKKLVGGVGVFFSVVLLSHASSHRGAHHGPVGALIVAAIGLALLWSVMRPHTDLILKGRL